MRAPNEGASKYISTFPEKNSSLNLALIVPIFSRSHYIAQRIDLACLLLVVR